MNKRAFVEYAAPLLCERVSITHARHDAACAAVLLAQELWSHIERLEPGRAIGTACPEPIPSQIGSLFR